MKKILLSLFTIGLLSSCATIFTSSKQDITFSGLEGIKIYDAASNIKIAEIGSSESVTIPIKKSLSSKTLLAKKDGYRATPIVLETTLSKTTLLNIFIPIGFAVDAATGQLFQWDNTVINIDMERNIESSDN